VLEGTKKTEGGVVALSETLGEMGIDAARAAGVFGVLSQNTERLREQMGIANAAFNEGSSVTKEYALRNENLAAQIEKLGKGETSYGRS
jgi:AmiR/NasT family two-component response regulator